MEIKSDSILGKEIHKHLTYLKLETPVFLNTNIKEQAKLDIIENSFKKIMNTLGLDLLNDSLENTPKRVAKMYLNELFYGLNYNNFPKCTTVKNTMNYDQMVVENNISVMSVCEHHFATIDGFATVAYIPKDTVLGLSKFNRIVDFFSRRPQIQERLTMQIAKTLEYVLKTDDIAIVIKAKHYCIKSRGIQDSNSLTTTSYLGGAFKNEPECRAEFLNLSK